MASLTQWTLFEKIPEDGEAPGNLVFGSPGGHKESDTPEQMKATMIKDLHSKPYYDQMLYIYSEHFRLYRYPRTTRKNCLNLGMARGFLILSVKGWVWSSRTSGERASLTDFLLRELFDNSAVNCWSCYNKLPQTGWLSNNRNLF